MGALDPLNLDTDGRLTCADCGQPVTGILLPISARQRPRADPQGSEIIADVVIDATASLHPCGHPYPTDHLPSSRLGEARPEN
jgi:hypothetical protein